MTSHMITTDYTECNDSFKQFRNGIESIQLIRKFRIHNYL